MKFLILMSLFASSLAQAYEVDNFTKRYQRLEPADAILDKKVNDVFAKVVEKANEENIGCSKVSDDDKRTMDGHRKFRALLREAVAPGKVVGVFEDLVDGNGSWLTVVLKKAGVSSGGDGNIPKHTVDLEKSVYGGEAQNKLILTAAGVNSSIRLGGEYIGADKLGHFFDQGFQYFKGWTLNGSKIWALQAGKSSEEGGFGKTTTGIMSYGDLAANYSGFQFWQSVTTGENPYFRCNNGQWSQVRKFAWADHVNPGWDEAINCNKYATKEMADSVRKNTKKLEDKGEGRRYVCPVDEVACAKLTKRPNASHYISPDCMKFKGTAGANGSTSSSQKGSGVR